MVCSNLNRQTAPLATASLDSFIVPQRIGVWAGRPPSSLLDHLIKKVPVFVGLDKHLALLVYGGRFIITSFNSSDSGDSSGELTSNYNII